MTSLIKINNISKTFGSFLAVDNLSFSIRKGEILGFLGPNGAGKTTTMRILTGFLAPTRGTVEIKGQNLKNNSINCRKLIGYVPEGSPLYNEMTVIDFLKFICEIREIEGLEIEKKVNSVVKLLKLENVIFQKIETLSKGFKRRVGLAQAIVHNPEILILDEPTDGLDPNQKNDVRNLIKELGKDKAIIISTHILEEINALCNRTMIISEGKLLIDDKPLNILKMSEFYNSIKLAVEEKDSFELKKTLISSKVAKFVDIEDELCIIRTKNYKRQKEEINKFLKRQMLTIKHLSTAKGSLEEVFRKMTSNE